MISVDLALKLLFRLGLHVSMKFKNVVTYLNSRRELAESFLSELGVARLDLVAILDSGLDLLLNNLMRLFC